ncbi:MAG: hypothetical protein BMS9Abin24_222 [Thermodesulfobacteriota bacterium]|nr:MAG: hypothetical protein BMS9Abin24_222 [Thermodesulfobacteriota bacterium]
MSSRKKILVKPEYQIKLALTYFISIIIYSAILGLIIFYPLYSSLNAAATIEEQTRISSMVLFLHQRVWIGFLIVAALAAVQAIFSSHRVVGPMYRFEKAVEELKAGNYGLRIRIRKRDEFKEMETLLNGLAETLELKRSRSVQLHHDVSTRLETISAMLDAEGAAYPEDVKRLTQGLIDQINAGGDKI